jgi:16S rRNA G966 N2-methylase RsmD
MTRAQRSPKNKTLQLLPAEIPELSASLLRGGAQANAFQTENILNKIIHADLFEILPALPRAFADLVFIDPPYNMDKEFHGVQFKEITKSISNPGCPAFSLAQKRTHRSIFAATGSRPRRYMRHWKSGP